MQSYVIGDIHGQLEMLRDAHWRIAQDRARHGNEGASVFHLGDYVDRGPDSAGVIQYLIEGISGNAPWVCLLGNHDRMFAMFLKDPVIQDHVLRKDYTWLHQQLGGRETLRSYGFESVDDASAEALFAQAHRVPSHHVEFLDSLKSFAETPELFIAHAGIRPGIALDWQSEDDLIWIRADFHKDLRWHGKLIVHGHTPVKKPTHYGNRVNLDSGAGYGHPLTTAVFDGNDVWTLDEKGRRDALMPPDPG